MSENLIELDATDMKRTREVGPPALLSDVEKIMANPDKPLGILAEDEKDQARVGRQLRRAAEYLGVRIKTRNIVREDEDGELTYIVGFQLAAEKETDEKHAA